MEHKEKLIQLGSCGRPHGVSGGFSATFFNTQDSSVRKGSRLVLKPKSESSSLKAEGESFTVKSSSFGNKVILFFDEVADRNQAEALLPFDIYIKRSDLPETSDDEFYIEDLVGMKVIGENGEDLGVVKNYFDNGAQLVLVIQKKDGRMELPFVEVFFPEIDLEAGTIKMIEPEII